MYQIKKQKEINEAIRKNNEQMVRKNHEKIARDCDILKNELKESN